KILDAPWEDCNRRRTGRWLLSAATTRVGEGAFGRPRFPRGEPAVVWVREDGEQPPPVAAATFTPARRPVDARRYRGEPARKSADPFVYTVVSPAGVRLYSFSSIREAEEEAAVLNAERDRLIAGATSP